MDHLSRAGGGEPLLLLHGLSHDRSAWAPMVDALAAHFDVVALDLPGHGTTPALDVPQSATALAGAVGETMDHLGWSTAHLAGSSLGGLVAVRLAEAGRARSVTAFSPAGMSRGWEHPWSRLVLRASHALAPRVEGISAITDTALGRRIALGALFGRPGELDPDYARAAIASPGAASGFRSTLRAIEDAGEIAPLDVPVTIAWGARDRLLPPVQGRRWKAAIPAARVVRLPGLGHLPMGEDPGLCVDLIVATAARADQPPRSDQVA